MSNPDFNRSYSVQIDPDAPEPSNPTLSPVRHLVATNFFADEMSNGGHFGLTSLSDPIGTYVSPAPPYGPAHRYAEAPRWKERPCADTFPQLRCSCLPPGESRSCLPVSQLQRAEPPELRFQELHGRAEHHPVQPRRRHLLHGVS